MGLLHRYIFRELLRTFILAAVAMTALMALAGGIFTIVKQEGVGPAELLIFFGYLTFSFLIFTLPIAALFAATIVFGRMAADNELTACRAAGINIHRLFRPGLLLALGVTAITTVFVNYTYPWLMERMERVGKRNLRAIAEHRLRTSGVFRIRTQFFVGSNQVAGDFEPAALRARGWPDTSEYLVVTQPVILQLDNAGQPVRLVTAEAGVCQFDTGHDPITVSVSVFNGRDCAPGEHHVGRLEQQTLGPIDISGYLPFRTKPSQLDLHTLVVDYFRPWEFSEVRDGVEKFRGLLLRQRFEQESAARIAAHEPIVLPDAAGFDWSVRAGQCVYDTPEKMTLLDVRIERGLNDPAQASRFDAPRAVLSLSRAPDPNDPNDVPLQCVLTGTTTQPVRASNPQSRRFGSAREDKDVSLPGAMRAPPEMVAAVRDYTPQELLQPQFDLQLTAPELKEARAKLIVAAAKLHRVIVSLLHFRFGFAACSLVIVLMGAALGVMFRGGRVLSAFGLASIPAGFVFMLMVIGRQVGERQGGEIAGAAIIWGGLAAMAIANGVLLRAGVAR